MLGLSTLYVFGRLSGVLTKRNFPRSFHYPSLSLIVDNQVQKTKKYDFVAVMMAVEAIRSFLALHL